jgi:hypothetical protein
MRYIPICIFLCLVAISGCVTHSSERSSFREFIEIGNGYEDISDLKEINGLPAFLATDSYRPAPRSAVGRFPTRSQNWFIVYNNEELGKNFISIDYFTEIDGKLTYVVSNYVHSADFDTFIVYDGKELGKTDSNYILVDSPTEVNRKLAYRALRGTGNKYWNSSREGYVVVYDETEGRVYDDLQDLTAINDKLCYFAFNQSKWFLVCNDYESENKYDGVVGPPIDVAGKVTYVAVNYLQTKAGYIQMKRFIVHDNQEIGKQYDDASFPVEINGSLAYLARQGDKSFIVYNGEKYGGKYVDVNRPIQINARLAYSVGKDFEKGKFIVYDGQEIGKQYYSVRDPLEIKGKLTFVTYRENWTTFIVYGNQEIGKNYEWANYPTEIDDKLAFVAMRDGKVFVVMEQ